MKENKRIIGTLTFHEAVNYGAVLQAYALQSAIRSLGYETEVLNYCCQQIKNSYYQRPASLKPLMGWYLLAKKRKVRQRRFGKFIFNNIRLSDPVTKQNLKTYSKKYELVIVGSDQVWNTKVTKGDPTYFLDFVQPTKRCSYAASIGLQSWPNNEEPLWIELVSSFRTITVREETAADYLESLTGDRPEVVCDPVFLLPREEWEKIRIDPKIKDDYVLLFSLGKPADDSLKWAKSQAAKLNYKLVVLHFGVLPIPGVINIRDAGPAEFLGWISNAKLVISPSYHVTCFSIIFNRQFCWFVSDGDAQNIKTSTSRLTDLFNLYGLTGRRVTQESPFPSFTDYSSVNKKVESIRRRSIGILERMLDE